MSERGYQHDFSATRPAMHDEAGRERKARTMLAVLRDHFGAALNGLSVLDVGASTGIIDAFLAQHVARLHGMDIDAAAVASAQQRYRAPNLSFSMGDAGRIEQADASFDVVICAQVYEHVPDAARMMAEIHRVLKPGGVCYFAASNRLMWNEPHYNLPLLSVLPRPLAHLYVRLAGKGSHYHELHYTWFGLRTLARAFEIIDYTLPILRDPAKFAAEYMLPPGSVKARVANWVGRYLYWAMPGYIWLLRKPAG